MGSEKAASHFTWKIEGFSKLGLEKKYSDVFEVDGLKWRLLVYPRGDGTAEEHLSVYLDVANAKELLYNWTLSASFCLTLINYGDREQHFRKECFHNYNNEESDWGHKEFIHRSELLDDQKGFRVNDCITIEVQITKASFIPCSSMRYCTPSPWASLVIVVRDGSEQEVELFADAKSMMEQSGYIKDALEIKQTEVGSDLQLPVKVTIDSKRSGISLATILSVLACVYGAIDGKVTERNVDKLLNAARFLQMPQLMQKCEDYILSSVESIESFKQSSLEKYKTEVLRSHTYHLEKAWNKILEKIRESTVEGYHDTWRVGRVALVKLIKDDAIREALDSNARLDLSVKALE